MTSLLLLLIATRLNACGARGQNAYTSSELVNDAIASVGYNPDNFGVALAVMLGIGVLYRLAAYVVLKRRGHYKAPKAGPAKARTSQS
jgi:hypothetical protein